MSTAIPELAKLIRYWSLTSTTAAGSGHPSSSLSAADLMASLFFGGFFRFDVQHPDNPNNDRLIFSKGHASPLFYSLWAAAGTVEEKELLTLRKFGSRLEGHPTMAFPYTEAATGSLGQGLSVGVGLAMNAKYLDKLPYRTFVLMGDSEMAEGSLWEAMALAAHYKLDNLVGIIDVNRLGQRGETMYGYDVKNYAKRISAFGWHTVVVDGHDIEDISEAYNETLRLAPLATLGLSSGRRQGKPIMIIAKTIKGKGVAMMEQDKTGYHGKALKPEELEQALKELGPVDASLRGSLIMPDQKKPSEYQPTAVTLEPISPDKPMSTRKAYGRGLVKAHPEFPAIVALDGETSNSTFSDIFQKAYPDRFFEMYIAEQNMVGTALGLSRRGKIPFVSTFTCFFTRAFDQIRMSRYSEANIKFVGSHAGVAIGEDGPSQMGLEDFTMFRSLLDSVCLYPSDAISAEKLVAVAARHRGIVYIRTTRSDTPILYSETESFEIGGSKTLKSSAKDLVTIVAAGITLHEALKAHAELATEGISVRVIDLYSIKPLDLATLKKASKETKAIITVEDHYAEGGIGEAVAAALVHEKTPVHILAVRKMPKSGTPDELLDYEGINSRAIVNAVTQLLNA